ncbi:MAG: hypothetical protein V7751_10870 [Pseudoalteromonas distincta]
MRWIAVLIAALMTLGCATNTNTVKPPTAPPSQEQARVELGTQRPADRISAYRLDGELVRGLRFPDLEAGAHNVQVRFHYEVPGSAGGTGMPGEAQMRTCILGIEYADFSPGVTYRFVADRLGIRPVGWLESADSQRLASAEILRCGPGA